MTQSKVKKIFKKILAEKRKNLTEHESRKVLQVYKIPVVKGKLATCADEAVRVARRIGYPVVLKICSPDIVHKTDAGGVILNLKSNQEVRAAFNKITKRIGQKVRFHGILVEKMVEGEEVIVGGKKDPQFGQTIMFGLGGIFTEIFKDVSFRIVPIKRRDALEMIRETRGYKILSGYRGKRYDIEALVEILLKTSRLLEENQEIRELDINPIKVLKRGAVVVDARIVI